jgi:hypothetical protein
MDYYFWTMAHSGWRYLALLFLTLALVKYAAGFLLNVEWGKFDRILGTVTTIVVDIQLVLGLVIWGWAAGIGIVGQPGTALRFMEHPVVMLLAIAVMHVGWVRGRKRETSVSKYSYALSTFAITSALIWFGVARVTGVV